MLYEKEGLARPSGVWNEQVGINAPDWTRTSTPLRAQALNLPRIPIPPQGLARPLYCLSNHLSTTECGWRKTSSQAPLDCSFVLQPLFDAVGWLMYLTDGGD
jgi:hypothetical protein